ncbi:magnesium-dependent phosphatase 1-like [Panonychus citri]|uniref:magnesium-dependent phosphatase 1-like n=1 Tax=Panonychus citri TaxID=50023 RepID=UPI00230707FA|nr:magnesium-dependent phosphatase 1-like [Panonychus citri]
MRITSLLRAAGKPRLALIDLDYTLWPWGIDQFKMVPPYMKKDNSVYDAKGVKMEPFPEAEKALNLIKDHGIELAAVSRSYYYHGGPILLFYYGWDKLFSHQEVFPARKTRHATNLHETTGIPYSEMILFDDEKRNIDDLAPLGVNCIEVNPKHGLTVDLVKKALENLSMGEKQKLKASN